MDIAQNHIHMFFCARLAEQLAGVGFHPVIRITEDDPFPAGGQKTVVAGGADSFVGFVNNLDAGIFCLIVITDGRTLVCASVIHKNDFDIGESLPKQAFYAAIQGGLGLIDRHNNTEFRHIFNLFA